jgi:hypothetical protein
MVWMPVLLRRAPVRAFSELMVLVAGDNLTTLRDAIAISAKPFLNPTTICHQDSPSFDAWTVNAAIVPFSENVKSNWPAPLARTPVALKQPESQSHFVTSTRYVALSETAPHPGPRPRIDPGMRRAFSLRPGRLHPAFGRHVVCQFGFADATATHDPGALLGRGGIMLG